MSTAEYINSTDMTCGGCEHTNHASAKFCTSCGHTLFENCPGCGQPVTLTAKFCNACGCNLKSHLQARLDRVEENIRKSIDLVKKFRFHEALNLLKLVANDKDYRFREQANTAATAIQKIEHLKEQSTQQFSVAKAAAQVAATNGNHQAVVEHLEGVSEELLDKESIDLLQQARQFLAEASRCKSELRNALGEKDWCSAAKLLETLLVLSPEHSTYKKLSREVSERLIGLAKADFVEHRYDQAHDKLESVSSECRNDTYESLKSQVADARWLVSQFDAEPFATPTLGRLAVRMTKHVPNNPLGTELVSKLSTKLKEAPAYRQSPFPAWTGSRDALIGGELRLLGWPRCLGDLLPDPIKKQPFRFGVALGLALQGVGEAKYDEQLNERKGFLEGLMSKKAQTAWGIDIGTSSIRAVCLKKDKATVTVTSAYCDEYPPTNQIAVASDTALRAREAIVKMLTEIEIGNAKVWVNFPGRETLPRFVLLPPVDDKKAKQLVDAEVGSQFPIDIDQLSLMRFVAESASDREGRPVSLISARKSAVSQRMDLLASAGLKVTGLQCEPVALANFAVKELADFIGIETPEQSLSSVAVIDSGASSTTLLILHRDGFWFRTIDSGGAELTTALARSAKVVGSEAEMLKRDPSKLLSLEPSYVEVEKKQHSLVERLRQLVPLAQKAFPSLQLDQTWLVGGNVLTHGLARRLSRQSMSHLIED